MKIKMNIKRKMLLFILLTSVIIFSISVGYINYKSRQLALKDAKKRALSVTHENALEIEKALSIDLAVLRTLSQAFLVYKDMPEEEWRSLFIKMYYHVFEKNTDFYKLWDSWEYKYFVQGWDKDYGRFSVNIYRKNGQIGHAVYERSLDGDNELYAKIKSINKQMLWEPYWDYYLEEGEQKQFMTSISAPIYRDNNFGGMVAADITMDRFQKLTQSIKPYDKTSAYLISNEGIFISHPNDELVGKSVSEFAPFFDEQFSLSTLIKEGKTGAFIGLDGNNNKVLLSLCPIQVGDYPAPWSLVLAVPVDVVLYDANKTQTVSLIVAIIGVLLISLIIYYMSKNISSALIMTTGILKKLSLGDIKAVDNLNIKRGDEIEDMANSVNALKEGLKETSVFAQEIGKGNLAVEFTPLSEKDVLGNSLIEMRKSLQHAKNEEEKRKIEDEKQNWATQGLAKFGEILRTNSHNIKQLSFNIMSNLISYLDINQGALFVVETEHNDEDDEVYLELKSAIAYGRDKYMKKRVVVGEGLVGRCAYEKKTIYLTDIPDDYIKITSGMGTANPTALLLVPLILNDEIFGVIELASFHEIEDYQIEFVEKLGESIASTIATVKINEKTSYLLEQSKSQAEELAAQEEEMRQNLEELQATQEEAARREYEMEGVINALGATAFIVEYDLDGIIIACNDKYSEVLGMPKEQIIGQSHQAGYVFDIESKANYDIFWGDLRRGESKHQINRVVYNTQEFWVDETYTPIISQTDGKPYKILKIGFDITEQKLKESEMQEQAEKINEESKIIDEYKNEITKLKKELEKIKKQSNISKHVDNKKEAEKISYDIKASGNNLLDWVDKFILGIEDIDEQHKQLIELVNSMFASFKLDKNKKEIKENIKSFVDFASYHFGNEEQYFEQFNYPESESHIKEHNEFIKQVKAFQSDYNANKVKFLDDIMSYIKVWLYRHFTEIDVKYVELFKSNGL